MVIGGQYPTKTLSCLILNGPPAEILYSYRHYQQMNLGNLDVIYLGRDIQLSVTKVMLKEEYEARRQERRKVLLVGALPTSRQYRQARLAAYGFQANFAARRGSSSNCPPS